MSPLEQRLELVRVSNAAAKQTTEIHLQGKHASSVRQQYDKRSRGDIHSALKAVATAMDSCHYPGRITTEPSVKMVFMVLCEVDEGQASCGSKTIGSVRKDKPAYNPNTFRSRSETNHEGIQSNSNV